MRNFLKTESWDIYGRYVFLALFLCVCCLCLLYVYFINLAVSKTAERNENLDKVMSMKREFQELETSYIGQLNKFSLSYAETLGFVESEPVAYIHSEKALVRGGDYEQLFR